MKTIEKNIQNLIHVGIHDCQSLCHKCMFSTTKSCFCEEEMKYIFYGVKYFCRLPEILLSFEKERISPQSLRKTIMENDNRFVAKQIIRNLI